MTALPKPAPKPKRQPARLKRTPLARRSAPIARGKRPRPMKKGAVADARREATRLMSRIVLARAEGWCESVTVGIRCTAKATDCAHVLGKKAWPVIRFAVNACAGLSTEQVERLRVVDLVAALHEVRRHVRNDGAGVERQLDRIDDAAHGALAFLSPVHPQRESGEGER